MKKSVSKPPRARALQAAPPALKKAKAAPELRASLSRLDTVTLGNRVFSAKPRELGGRKLDILPDMPDIRDRIYQPHLRALHPAIYPRIAFPILDQGPQSSCTGFSLAHLIDFLRFREVGGNYPERVSARMLYEMAKRNDEWDGTAYEGSSIRGAIKGFFRSGVCSDKLAPAHATGEWALTYDMAKEARETRLGAFFRVEPDISDYHAALNEVGAIYASAQIHTHWNAPDSKGSIQSGGKPVGGHAFAIVGYDDSGFWILNSWGQTWGRGGIAHWGYADWAATVMDAWVLQLGARAPAAFSAIPRATPSGTTGLFGSGDPHRGDIVGHFINIDDGRYVENGKYGSPSAIEMQQTVERLTMPTSNEGKGYDHLVIYAHGGLNKLEDDAKRIATWKRNKIFSRNNLYNFHLMWGSGLIDEVFGEISKSSAGRAAGRISDWLFEVAGKEIGAYAWRNMKQDANVAFYKQDANVNPEYDGGFVGLKPLLSGLDAAAKRPKLHLVGHSAGAIVLGHLLSALRRFKLTNLELGSIHLMAPACTVAFFREHYHPYLAGTGGRKLLDKIYLYNLTDELELDDTVSSSIPLLPTYARSLLYLVSRAYEEKPETPLAGMERYGMPQGAKLDIAYSKCKGGKVTASPSHGGFDNDPATISTIMTRIAGKPLKEPPTEDELTGY